MGDYMNIELYVLLYLCIVKFITCYDTSLKFGHGEY